MSQSDDSEWIPPTEAEQKVLAARRERSDKISKLMGDYLLKGHKMLATTCLKCSTIEMEDKQGRIYCIGCAEVDNQETAKDDPVIDARAARSQLLERPLPEVPKRMRASKPLPPEPVAANECVSSGIMVVSGMKEEATECAEVVLRKMSDAKKVLNVTSLMGDEVQAARDLVGLIKDCAECLEALKQVK